MRKAALCKLFTAVVAALLASGAQADEGGKLLIVGGALRGDNAAVYRAFIESIPAKYPEVAIVPAASGRPAYYAEAFRADLRRHGFDGRVEILPVAVSDDPATDVDESGWLRGAHDRHLAERLEKVGGIWFVGGDQTRITDTLLLQDGGDTPLLAAIRVQLARGAVVGGTSAGAAIMSRTMIAAGDSLSALTLPQAERYDGMQAQESGQLLMKRGLGFLETGIVDQHFDRKSRLGRLVRALAPPMATEERRGFGIDEDTALLADLSSGDMHVLGAGNLTLLDAREAEFNLSAGRFSVDDIRLSVLSDGDSYNWKTGTMQSSGSATAGKEAFAYRPEQGAGIALPNSRLDQLLGFSLLDNSESRELRRYAFNESGRAILFRFEQTDESQGFWRYGSGTKDQYSIGNVQLSIRPVTITVKH
ncbi:cyanophycinase [Microbulbifer magnicolonia]|uniref:cyanophycinase n=1 Tax=Microbulbifer magnicolonia TaxID=3109744 RepID=UPI002B415B6B|nr:cyanophycinase [Microbulbifer sp. GG15]